jgi:formate-dependent nitrite reductase membrane component NrfD
MPDAFSEFIAQEPFWGVIIIVLMVLPIIGAVAWVILRALKRTDDGSSK